MFRNDSVSLLPFWLWPRDHGKFRQRPQDEVLTCLCDLKKLQILARLALKCKPSKALMPLSLTDWLIDQFLFAAHSEYKKKKGIKAVIAKSGNENAKEHFPRKLLLHKPTCFLHHFEMWWRWLDICLVLSDCQVMGYSAQITNALSSSGSCCSWLRCNDWVHLLCSREVHCSLGNKIKFPVMATSTFEPTDYDIKKIPRIN